MKPETIKLIAEALGYKLDPEFACHYWDNTGNAAGTKMLHLFSLTDPAIVPKMIEYLIHRGYEVGENKAGVYVSYGSAFDYRNYRESLTQCVIDAMIKEIGE